MYGMHGDHGDSGSSDDSFYSCKNESFDNWQSCDSETYEGPIYRNTRSFCKGDFDENVDKDVKYLREVINSRELQIFDLYQLYGRNYFLQPISQEDRMLELRFMDIFKKHHDEKPGKFNTIGALRYFRKKLEETDDCEEFLRTFPFYNFRMTLIPTKYDKPNFTGPYIAGPLSEELEDLYERYDVREGEWKEFLQNLMYRKDIPLFDKELATHIMNRLNFRNIEYSSIRGLDKHRGGLRKGFSKEAIDLSTTNDIYRYIQKYDEKNKMNENLRKSYNIRDKEFVHHLQNYRHRNPGPFDTVRAFRYYRKKINPDLDYFNDPKFYHFDNYRIIKAPLVKDYPADFTGPLLAGPYSHELQEIYDRYQVKPGKWKEFLLKLLKDKNASIYDQELAKYVLNKEKQLKKDIAQCIDIDAIRDEFYKRATRHDWIMYNKILSRQK